MGRDETASGPAVPAGSRLVRLVVNAGRSTARVDGRPVPVAPGQSAYEAAVHCAALVAVEAGEPVWCMGEDESGRTRFLVHPDGHSSDVKHFGAGGRRRSPAEEPER